MRKRKRNKLLRREQRESNRDIRIFSDLLDYYHLSFKDKTEIDLIISMYEPIMALVLQCENKMKHRDSDYMSISGSYKCPGLKKHIIISVWCEKTYHHESDKISLQTLIQLGIQSRMKLISMREIEDEITERFLGG